MPQKSRDKSNKSITSSLVWITSQQQSKIKFQIGHLKQTILKHANLYIITTIKKGKKWRPKIILMMYYSYHRGSS